MSKDRATQSDSELHEQSGVVKSLPLVKIKRVRGGLYRVYKLVNGNYKIKRTFFTMHQANRYVKGFKK